MIKYVMILKKMGNGSKMLLPRNISSYTFTEAQNNETPNLP